VPQLIVYNKIDLAGELSGVARDETGRVRSVRLSARNGDGVERLIDALRERFGEGRVAGTVHLDASEARLRAKFYDADMVRRETEDEAGGWDIDVEAPRVALERFCRDTGLNQGRIRSRACEGSGASLQSRTTA
jgi:GTPase